MVQNICYFGNMQFLRGTKKIISLLKQLQSQLFEMAIVFGCLRVMAIQFSIKDITFFGEIGETYSESKRGLRRHF